jgi:hypothetical protein
LENPAEKEEIEVMKKLIKIIFIVAALLVYSSTSAYAEVISIAENAGIDPDFFKKYDPKAPPLKPDSPPSPLSTLSRAKEMHAKAIAEIKNLEMEIRKNEETIQKSAKLISLAREKKNVQAEIVGREALSKAQEAKKKNEETLRFYKIYQNLLTNLISKLENAISTAAQAECNGEELRRNYEGFKKAIKEFTKTVQMNTKEYQEWEKELQDAQIEGLQAFVSTISWETQNLKKIREEKLQGLRRQLDNYMEKLNDKELLKNQYLLDRLKNKMAKANQHYLQTEDAVQALAKIDQTTKLQDVINVSTNSINLWCQEIKNGDTEILNLLKDPEIRNLAGDLAASFTQYVGEYEEMIRGTDKILGPMLRRLNLAISGFGLLRDVVYAGLHLKLSLDRLTQLGEVGEQSYRAMQSLIENKKEIETKLKECGCAYKP